MALQTGGDLDGSAKKIGARSTPSLLWAPDVDGRVTFPPERPDMFLSNTFTARRPNDEEK